MKTQEGFQTVSNNVLSYLINTTELTETALSSPDAVVRT